LVGGPSARARLNGPVYRRRVILRGVLPREEKPPIVVRRLESRAVEAMGGPGPGIEARGLKPTLRYEYDPIDNDSTWGPPTTSYGEHRPAVCISLRTLFRGAALRAVSALRPNQLRTSFHHRPPSTCRCKVYSVLVNQSFPPTILVRVVAEEPAQLLKGRQGGTRQHKTLASTSQSTSSKSRIDLVKTPMPLSPRA
jgi:hypothetical protein